MEFIECASPIIVSICKIRLNSNCLVKAHQGILKLSQLFQRYAPIQIGIGMLWIQSDRLVITGDRCFKLRQAA